MTGPDRSGTVVCPVCGGHGRLDVAVYPERGVMVECALCEARGRVTLEKAESWREAPTLPPAAPIGPMLRDSDSGVAFTSGIEADEGDEIA